MPRLSPPQTACADPEGPAGGIAVALSGSVCVRTPAGFRLLDIHMANGQGWLRFGDATPVRLAARSFTLAPAGAPQRLAVRSAGRFLRVRLDPGALPSLSPAMLAGVVIGRDAALNDAAEALADRLRDGRSAPRQAVDALFAALCAALDCGPGAGLRVIDGAGCVARALDFIHRHLDHRMTATVVAAAAGASRQHVARRFRLATGVTIREYVLRRRIAQAASLLQTGGGSIADVAYAVGFGSQSHMTTHFRRRLGRTPAEVTRR